MTWNYRLVSVAGFLGLYEVYYDGDRAIARTVDPISFSGYSDPEVARRDITLAHSDALNRPVLLDSDIGSGT